MKIKRLLILVILSVLISFSCDDVDDEGPYRQIVLSIPPGFTPSTIPATKWAFITNSEGGVIDYRRLIGDDGVILSIPASVQDETVTLNFFTTTLGTPKHNDLISFAGIVPGSYEIKLSEHLPPPIGPASITVDNLPADIDLSVSGEARVLARAGDKLTLEVLDFQSGLSELVCAFDESEKEGRYSYLKVFTYDDLSVDYSSMNSLDKSTVPINLDSGFIEQVGMKDDFEFKFRNTKFNSLNATLFHLDDFDSYFTSISAYDNNDLYTNVFLAKHLQPPLLSLKQTQRLFLPAVPPSV
jgi:hypothetical protein